VTGVAAGGAQEAQVPGAPPPPHPVAGPSKPGAPGASIDVDEPELECGCCFGSYPFVEMVQCADAHLFCSGCIRAYAGTKLGEQSCALVCMETAGCSAAFAESELRRVLDAGLLGLYERLRARDALKGAALEGLAECPFCDFACVMEDEADRLLRCQNETCSVVSCRLCKKPVGASVADGDAGLNLV
jgi:TRIAD3 protein (E3 ubiquitin-protein ligase RNF216)